MYLPRSFAEQDLSALDRLIARDNFVSLVTVRDGSPVINHLPVLYVRDGDAIELRGHWARPNPQSGHAGPATAIIHGPHGYISPAWYPDREAAARVPTWDYAVAHLTGVLHTTEDETALGAIVDDLSKQHEARVGSDWRYDHGNDALRVQLKGIIGFRLVVERIELKFKLNQNHPVANREAIAAQLWTQSRDASRELADLIRERLPTGA
jgi:transcriptional regulator